MSLLGITKSPFETREDIHSTRAFVADHLDELEDWVIERFPDESEEGHMMDLMERPYVARSIIENMQASDEAKWRKIVDYFAHVDSSITLTIGRRRHWKTITTTDIVYEVSQRTGQEVYGIGLADGGPDWIIPVPGIEDVPFAALTLWDEMGADAGARTSTQGDQRTLPGQLAVAGHNALKLFGIVQNSSIADKTIYTMADNLLWKPASLTQIDTERAGLRRVMRRWRELMPREKWESFLLGSDLGPVTWERGIPEWWEQSYSMAYAKIVDETAGLLIAARLRASQRNWNQVHTRMRMRGVRLHPTTWARRVKEFNGGEDPIKGGLSPELLRMVRQGAARKVVA